MADTTVTVNEPALVEVKRVDNAGRLYLGQDFEGEHVRIVVERMEETDE